MPGELISLAVKPEDSASSDDELANVVARTRSPKMQQYPNGGLEIMPNAVPNGAELTKLYFRLKHSDPGRAKRVLETLINRDLPTQESRFSNDDMNALFIRICKDFTKGGRNVETYYPNSITQNVIERAQKRPKGPVVNADIILYPFLQSAHWFLGIARKNMVPGQPPFEVFVLDSKNRVDVHEHVANPLTALLQAVHKCAVHQKSIRVPMQMHDDDCGPAISFFAQQFCKNVNLADYEPYSRNLCNYRKGRIGDAAALASPMPRHAVPVVQNFQNYCAAQGSAFPGVAPASHAAPQSAKPAGRLGA
jgi:hypothetical protein